MVGKGFNWFIIQPNSGLLLKWKNNFRFLGGVTNLDSFQRNILNREVSFFGQLSAQSTQTDRQTDHYMKLVLKHYVKCKHKTQQQSESYCLHHVGVSNLHTCTQKFTVTPSPWSSGWKPLTTTPWYMSLRSDCITMRSRPSLAASVSC